MNNNRILGKKMSSLLTPELIYLDLFERNSQDRKLLA